MTVIPIVIAALGTVTGGLVQGLEGMEIIGQVETIQTTALLRSARILKIWGDSLSLWLQWYYLPTPPLGQDMTQGQFLSGV